MTETINPAEVFKSRQNFSNFIEQSADAVINDLRLSQKTAPHYLSSINSKLGRNFGCGEQTCGKSKGIHLLVHRK